MLTLHRKLLRDIAAMKGQVAAIAVVIAAGVMTLIIAVSSLDALRLSMDSYYESHHFAEVFADLTRAPERTGDRIAALPGVNRVETRVRAPVRLLVDGFAEPVRGMLVSIPDGRQPELNRLHLREGALPESGRGDQVVVSEPFAQAHRLRPGEAIGAIIDGRRERLSISGVALSPEFVYQIGPADLMPDYARYGVLWMNRRPLATALDMDGAFNSLVLSLQAGAEEAPVIDAVDRILARYGGIGAHGREDQISHRFLSEELAQLRVMAVMLPTIFLGVSAFLLSVLMGRIVHTQRQQIAVLKAFGYGTTDIAVHFGLLTALIVALGAALGVVAGAWAGHGLAMVYTEYFRFPELRMQLRPSAVLLGTAVAALAAALGTWRAVGHAVRLPPAEAMRPPAPERFRQGWLERTWLWRLLDQPSRIVLRNLSRHRLKAAMSSLGIAMSVALLLVGAYQFGAIDHMLDVQYRLVQRMDVHVSYTDPTPEHSLAELRHKPGVRFAEGYRSVPVRLVHGTRDYRTALLGIDVVPRLRGLIDADLTPIVLPPEGILLTDYLAAHLGVREGDRLQAEVMEGHRRTVSVLVAGTVSEPVGVSAYMERRALNRMMREGPALSGAWLMVDADARGALFDALDEVPRVASVGLVAQAESVLREYIADTGLTIMGIMLLLAASIAFAVVYNNARIAFAERARELATLRVLGFARSEVGWILVGETFLLTLLAIPLGWLIGTAFAYLLNLAMSMDLFRLPFIITVDTYAFAAGGVIVAASLSVLLVARRLRRLDMVSALKTE